MTTTTAGTAIIIGKLLDEVFVSTICFTGSDVEFTLGTICDILVCITGPVSVKETIMFDKHKF